MDTQWVVFVRDEEHMMDIPIVRCASASDCWDYAAKHNGPEFLQAKEQVRSGNLWLDTLTPQFNMPRWEIARLCGYGSKAGRVFGPFFDFLTTRAALHRMNDNRTDAEKDVGKVWVWANWGEVPRSPQCEVTHGFPTE